MIPALRHAELTTGSASDIAAIERVMAHAFEPKYGESWSRGQCLGVLAMPGVWLTLAHASDDIVGFALARAVLDEAELLLLAVMPKARRRGIGAALLRSVIAEARGRGIARLHLEVRAGNSAIPLYDAAGFDKVGARRAYYRGANGRAYDAHSYALRLA